MLFLTSTDVERLVDIEDVIDDLEAGYEQFGRAEITEVPRETVRSPAVEGNLKSMPAVGAPGLGGIFYTGGWADRPDVVSKLVVVFDDADGDLLCVIEGDRLSWLRTGATSGVATDYCAREDAATLGIVGAGKQARSQLLAVAAVRDLDRVRVHSRTTATREGFADEMADAVDAEIEPVAEAREAVEGCDVVCTATTSPTPVLSGEWLDPGTHVNAIGAHYPDQREVDTETIRRSRVIVDALNRARKEEGELIVPADEGAFDWAHATELGAVVAGEAPGRRSEDEITFLTSGGLSMEYLVTGRGIYDRAVAAGLGAELEMDPSGRV